MADIFISYASQDRETARQLAERLGEAGYAVWWDRTIPPGRVFDEVIQEALASARSVVVLWSAHAVRSNWVKVEAEEALARHRLMPVLIEQVMPPFQFKRIQAANLTRWNGDADDPEFLKLVASIERLVRQADQKPTAPLAATDRPEFDRRPNRIPAIAIVIAVAVALAGAAAWLYFGSGPSGNGDGSSPSQPSAQAPGTPGPASSAAGGPPTAAARPAEPTSAAAPVLRGPRINLVAAENGGELLTADDALWKATVDGDEDTYLWVPFYIGGKSQAVFGFKDGRSATFDTVEILIPGSGGNNVAEFELQRANDAIDGPFESIRVFKTRNMLILKERYQRFTFPATTARFVRFRLLRAHADATSPYLYEWRLLGALN
jgi:hypothetical protein